MRPIPPVPRCLPSRAGLALAGLALLGACATTPPVAEPERVLQTAEAQLTAGEPAAVIDDLLGRGLEAFPRRLRDRFDLLLARAHLALGDTVACQEVLTAFADRYPHSERRIEVQELLWKLATDLVTRDSGLWLFWSDRRDARNILEHLITRHPDTRHLADALRVLGDLAYDDGDYALAMTRFGDLMQQRPDSDWVKYARFRYASSIVAGVAGVDYDLDQMEHAERELQAYLASGDEHPGHRQEATAALARMLDWQSRRHLWIAGFYATVGNPAGRRRHLELAAAERFAGTAGQVEAKVLLQELGPPPAGGRP